MPRKTLDAIEAATSIHQGDFSILRGKSFLVCDNMKKKKRRKHVKKPKKSRMDRLEESITKLAIEMREGFKQVNARIDRIDNRLDYIVKANNLKDYDNLKKSPIDSK